MKISKATLVGNQEYIPEPFLEEKCSIYASQVIIPLAISDEIHVYMGPLPSFDMKSLKYFIPTQHKHRPLASKNSLNDRGKVIFVEEKNEKENNVRSSKKVSLAHETIHLEYMTNTLKVFRDIPLAKDPEPYYSWLAKVESKKAQFLKDLGIFVLVQLSQTGLEYNQEMLMASLYFWDATHNTFHLPCGMVTPTLFDVAAVTGLHPLGEDFDPNYMDNDTIKFGEIKATYTIFTAKHHNKDNDEVSDEEYIAFSAVWLSRCIFCSRSLQVAKRYLVMVN